MFTDSDVLDLGVCLRLLKKIIVCVPIFIMLTIYLVHKYLPYKDKESNSTSSATAQDSWSCD
uniref:Uncharacterized protein n=1 Tax=Lepeophtheirus salmonis TaxID=72036 RepID=A0A0K2TW31_LEPSM